MLTALSWTNPTVYVGGNWTIRVLASDDTREPVDVAGTVTVTAPDGTVTAGVTTVASSRVRGISYVTIVPLEPGRYVVAVTVPGAGVAYFTATAVEPTATAAMPDVQDCVDYMGGDDAISFTDDDVQQALDQETSAQARVCRIPAAYPADLRGALLRRVQRALAMRSLSLAVRESTDGESTIIVPGRDPEVRRLEAPYRKVMLG